MNNIFRVTLTTKTNILKCFTLAEVLVVLLVLGVLAAITVPSFIQKYQRKTTVIKVKRFYNTLETMHSSEIIKNNNEALSLSDYANGSAGVTNIYNDLVRHYFNISYNAGTTPANKQKIMATSAYKTLEGDDYTTAYTTSKSYYAVQLKDGGTLWFRGVQANSNNNTIAFWYDVNGPKEPNTIGKDVFINSIALGKRDLSYLPTKETAEKCYDRGWTCMSWVVAKGNLKYLDCPNYKIDFDTETCTE